MPRRDIYHYDVRTSLEKEGWTITADPITLEWEDALYYPDLGAERVIAAQKGLEKIAVEIKSFINPSFSQDFYEALGQYDNYFIALSELEPDRKVILAICKDAYEQFFYKKAVQRVLEIKKIPVLVFDSETKTIVKWIR
jgi:hypothetical protein